MAADVDTKYMLHSIPYLGKDDSRPAGVKLGEHVVLQLIEPYRRTGRNVTTGNQNCRNCKSHPKRDSARNQKNEVSLHNKNFQT